MGHTRNPSWTGLFKTLCVLAAVASATGVPVAMADTAAVSDPDALAVVGGSVITVERFEAEMARRGGHLPGQYATVEQRQALLDELIAFEAQAEAARRDGIDRDPETLELIKRILVTRYRDARVDSALAAVEVTDEDVAAHYEDHMDQFARPERIQGAIVHIRVPPQAPPAKKLELEQRAQLALAEAGQLDPSVRHFGPVARRYSEDASSRYRGGVIGWLVPDSERDYKWPDAVLAALFALEEPGAIGAPVQTEDAIYLVRLVERQPSEVRPLAAIAEGIRMRLLKQERDAVRARLMDELLAELRVEIDGEKLQAIAPPNDGVDPQADHRPPPLPGS